MQPTRKGDCEYNIVGTGMPVLGLGIRHLQALLLFLGLAISEATSVSLSVGIVAMTDLFNTNADVEIFTWDKQTQDIVLSSVLWGYTLMQLPAGQLAHMYGGKSLLVWAMLVSGVASLLIPWSAHMGGWKAMCVCRVFQGFAQGAFLPALHTFLGKWAPVNERSRFGACVYGGAQVGTVICMVMSGFLASSSYGWPAIFYSLGSVSVVFAIILYLFAADSPAQHKSISIEEKLYIQSSLGQVNVNESLRVPWKAILSSSPFWAIVIAHIGCFWGYATFLAEIPSYINRVLGADIKQNGLISALPYLAMWFMSFVCSFISDYCINKQHCTITVSRKIANTIGTWIPAIGLIGLSYIPLTNIPLTITVLVITISTLASTFVGFSINMIDLAPNFAGTLMSISCFWANLFTIMTPITAGLILVDDTDQTQWRIVFFVAAGILFFTNLFFVLFGSADLMPWNEPHYLRRHDSVSTEDADLKKVESEEDR